MGHTARNLIIDQSKKNRGWKEEAPRIRAENKQMAAPRFEGGDLFPDLTLRPRIKKEQQENAVELKPEDLMWLLSRVKVIGVRVGAMYLSSFTTLKNPVTIKNIGAQIAIRSAGYSTNLKLLSSRLPQLYVTDEERPYLATIHFFFPDRTNASIDIMAPVGLSIHGLLGERGKIL